MSRLDKRILDACSQERIVMFMMTRRRLARFQVRSKEEERNLLDEGLDYSRLTRYLKPLLDDLLVDSGLTLEDQFVLKAFLIEDIPRLARRFLQLHRDWKFSAYFAFHVLNRIKRARRLASF